MGRVRMFYFKKGEEKKVLKHFSQQEKVVLDVNLYENILFFCFREILEQKVIKC